MRKFLLALMVLLFSVTIAHPVMAQGTILDVAAGNEDLSTLVTVIEAASPEVAETLGGAGSFTVLAPTNTAFENLASFLDIPLADLLQQPDLLASILLYHVQGGVVTSEQIRSQLNGAVVPTLLDSAFVNFDVTDEGEILVNDVVEIVQADIAASNGIVHVINDVLLNRVINEQIEATDFSVPGVDDSDNEIDDIVSAADEFQALLEALNVADSDVIDTLGQSGPFTLFAPSNEAFENLLADLEVESIADLDFEIVTQILLYHVIEGEFTAAELAELDGDDESQFTLLEDEAIIFGFNESEAENEEGVVTLNSMVEVTEADIGADNGIIHIIDNVLLPQPVINALAE